MSDIVDRVMKLVMLASSPEKEEARTAAHKACELIREHKLQVTLSVHAAHVAAAHRQPPSQPQGFIRCPRHGYLSYGGNCPGCALEELRRQTQWQRPTPPPREIDRCKRCNRPSPNGDLCSRCSSTHDASYTIECKTCGAFVRGVSAQGVCDRAAAAGFYTAGDDTFCSRH